jgi:hypothetical protein
VTLPKLLGILAFILFSVICIAALFKSNSEDQHPLVETTRLQLPLEVELEEDVHPVTPAPIVPAPIINIDKALHEKSDEVGTIKELPSLSVILPEADRIEELFNKQAPRLEIVETVTYKSHVPWQKGRPAWLSDYASHYNTSKHFIARSLNGKADYWKQEVKEGDRFNVFRNDKNFHFHLVVDSSRCKMWFYYLDLDQKQKILLKTYQVGLGRIDSSKTSGLLTPLGIYSLGRKIGIYKPKMNGTHLGKQKEMITVFGTRWIPFEKEIGVCTLPAKGFGVHGTPWTCHVEGKPSDNPASIGKYESDGCIRLKTDDMEEIFSIIITKPATIEIVRDFSEATFAI